MPVTIGINAGRMEVKMFCVPEQPESPPSATPEQIWLRDRIEEIGQVTVQVGQVEEMLIGLEDRIARNNRKRVSYNPWFPILNMGQGDYSISETRTLRERLQALKEDLEEELGEEG